MISLQNTSATMEHSMCTLSYGRWLPTTSRVSPILYHLAGKDFRPRDLVARWDWIVPAAPLLAYTIRKDADKHHSQFKSYSRVRAIWNCKGLKSVHVSHGVPPFWLTVSTRERHSRWHRRTATSHFELGTFHVELGT